MIAGRRASWRRASRSVTSLMQLASRTEARRGAANRTCRVGEAPCEQRARCERHPDRRERWHDEPGRHGSHGELRGDHRLPHRFGRPLEAPMKREQRRECLYRRAEEHCEAAHEAERAPIASAAHGFASSAPSMIMSGTAAVMT